MCVSISCTHAMEERLLLLTRVGAGRGLVYGALPLVLWLHHGAGVLWTASGIGIIQKGSRLGVLNVTFRYRVDVQSSSPDTCYLREGAAALAGNTSSAQRQRQQRQLSQSELQSYCYYCVHNVS